MHHHSWLVRFASKVLKYFLLGLFGVLVTVLFSGIVGFLPLTALFSEQCPVNSGETGYS